MILLVHFNVNYIFNWFNDVQKIQIKERKVKLILYYCSYSIKCNPSIHRHIRQEF
jgi:hypothetical protein